MRTTPRSVFDYVDGGSDTEITVNRNRAAFGMIDLMPEYLSAVANPDLSTTVLGHDLAFPLFLAPHRVYEDDAS